MTAEVTAKLNPNPNLNPPLGHIVVSENGAIIRVEGSIADPLGVVSHIFEALGHINKILHQGESARRVTIMFDDVEYIVGYSCDRNYHIYQRQVRPTAQQHHSPREETSLNPINSTTTTSSTGTQPQSATSATESAPSSTDKPQSGAGGGGGSQPGQPSIANIPVGVGSGGGGSSGGQGASTPTTTQLQHSHTHSHAGPTSSAASSSQVVATMLEHVETVGAQHHVE